MDNVTIKHLDGKTKVRPRSFWDKQKNFLSKRGWSLQEKIETVDLPAAKEPVKETPKQDLPPAVEAKKDEDIVDPFVEANVVTPKEVKKVIKRRRSKNKNKPVKG